MTPNTHLHTVSQNHLEKNRNTVIDDLRGFGIFVMILIHTNVYFLNNTLAYTLLQLSQFAVPLFIFCSAYLTFQKDTTLTAQTVIPYIRKRITRLLAPYYIFLIFYLVLAFVAERSKVTVSYILKNIFVTGGIDFNWLVLLFIEFVFLMPFLSFLRKKHPLLFLLFFAGSLMSSLLFLTHTPLPYFRYIMWLPWSLVVLFSLLFVELEHSKKFLILAIMTSGLIFFLSQTYQTLTFHSLFHQSNKYPPNLYHLSYGVFAVLILYFIAKRNVFSPFRRVFTFLSTYSYSIYFVHILVIYVFTKFFRIQFSWISFFVTVLTASIAIQWIINKSSTFFQHYRAVRQSEYSQGRGH